MTHCKWWVDDELTWWTSPLNRRACSGGPVLLCRCFYSNTVLSLSQYFQKEIHKYVNWLRAVFEIVTDWWTFSVEDVLRWRQTAVCRVSLQESSFILYKSLFYGKVSAFHRWTTQHSGHLPLRLQCIWTGWWIYHTSSQAHIMDPCVRVRLQGVSRRAPCVSWPLWELLGWMSVCACGFVAAGIRRYTGHRSHGAAIIHRQEWRWIMLPLLPPLGPPVLAGQAFGWPAVIKTTAGCLSAWRITLLALICTQRRHTRTCSVCDAKPD